MTDIIPPKPLTVQTDKAVHTSPEMHKQPQQAPENGPLRTSHKAHPSTKDNPDLASSREPS